MTAKDSAGNLIWLETGNENAGLKHILNGNGQSSGHAKDFQNAFGIISKNIPTFIKTVVSDGKLISNSKVSLKNGRYGFERIYYVNGTHYLLTGVGSNGFIVTSYPIKIKIKGD